MEFARYLNNINKPTWVRFVCVPGLTDPKENVDNLAYFFAPLKNVDRVEVMLFHPMSAIKWEALGYDYTLEDIVLPADEWVGTSLFSISLTGINRCQSGSVKAAVSKRQIPSRLR
ncbi:MAG: hypothetical protein F6K30_07850 [Cyanothece sp. SIO2G6]|nr:hypothetical protein [Cyanothece sp. SIO2G6]